MVKHKTVKRGRPRDMAVVARGDNPDNYPSLSAYLKAKGKLKHITQAQLYKAKFLYMRGYTSEQIAHDLQIEPAVVDRWAMVFAWDEERDRRLFEQFRKLSALDKPYEGDLASRHERIATTIEQVAERLLRRSSEGHELSARDLATLASTLKSTQDIRRTARGVASPRDKENSSNNTLNVVVGEASRIADALATVFERPQLEQRKSTTMAIGVEEHIGCDTEYEEATDGNS